MKKAAQRTRTGRQADSIYERLGKGVCKAACNNRAPYNNKLLPCASALRKAGKKAGHPTIAIRRLFKKCRIYRRKRKMPDHPSLGTECIRHGLSIWCLRAESNRRHRDFQSLALPTELPRQVADHTGFEPVVSSVTGKHVRPLHQWSTASTTPVYYYEMAQLFQEVISPEPPERGKGFYHRPHLANRRLRSPPSLRLFEGAGEDASLA